MHGLTYPELAEASEQWPIVGRSDLYYGGTTYENKQGLGVQLAAGQPESRLARSASWTGSLPEHSFDLAKMTEQGLIWLVPVTRLYDRGTTVTPSQLLARAPGGSADLRCTRRRPPAWIWLKEMIVPV